MTTERAPSEYREREKRMRRYCCLVVASLNSVLASCKNPKHKIKLHTAHPQKLRVEILRHVTSVLRACMTARLFVFTQRLKNSNNKIKKPAIWFYNTLSVNATPQQ